MMTALPAKTDEVVAYLAQRNGVRASLVADLLAEMQFGARAAAENLTEAEAKDVADKLNKLGVKTDIRDQLTLSPRDLIEAIAGEFKPDDHEDAWAIQRQDGTWLLDGIIPVPELKDTLGLEAVPEEDKGRYNTLSGMLMLLMGRIPSAGEAVEWEHWRFEVVDMDGKRIDKVLASPIATPDPASEF